MDELYKKYGQLMVQAEIIQAQINQVKQQIAQELAKQPTEKKDG